MATVGDGDKNLDLDLEALLGQGVKELVLCDSSDEDETATTGNGGSKTVSAATTSSEPAALATAAPTVVSPVKVTVPLFDASKMGFNDKAWNDPPELLMSTSPGTGGSGPIRSKLTERVAFPLDYERQQAKAPHAQKLDPKGPPPTTGFVKKADASAPKTPPPDEDDKTE